MMAQPHGGVPAIDDPRRGVEEAWKWIQEFEFQADQRKLKESFKLK
jgi:hypothetical protein